MNAHELQNWMRLTRSSESQWRMDPVLHANRGLALFYIGGRDGAYVCVGADGLTTGGVYEGALPHIGEAGFREQHRRIFPDQRSAIESLAARFGETFARAASPGLSR